MKLWKMKNNRYQSEDQALHQSLCPGPVVPAEVRNTSNRAVVAAIRSDIL